MIDFSEYSERTQVVLSQLVNTLKDETTISTAMEAQLSLLADNLDIYYNALEDIKSRGIVCATERGLVKNPATSIYNSTAQYITRLMSSLGLTRAAKAKLMQAGDDCEVSPIDEFV